MGWAAPLIDEAWEHHRGRRRRITTAAVALAGVIAGIYPLVMNDSPQPVARGISLPPGAVPVTPATVFSQAPYMGVRCPTSNSIACDRVGLAIWLKHPAIAVRASIAGAPLSLNWFGDRRLSSDRPHRAFDGYLQPAGIVSRLHVRPDAGPHIWLGDATPSPIVWVLIEYRSGSYAVTHLRVPLSAGWG